MVYCERCRLFYFDTERRVHFFSRWCVTRDSLCHSGYSLSISYRSPYAQEKRHPGISCTPESVVLGGIICAFLFIFIKFFFSHCQLSIFIYFIVGTEICHSIKQVFLNQICNDTRDILPGFYTKEVREFDIMDSFP